jgi:hypothetical protein
VPRPAFQLVLNNFNVLRYHFADETSVSQSFIFVVDGEATNSENLENYSIMFTYPLSIGAGRLSQKNYIVWAQKGEVLIPFSDSIGIIVVVIAYILIYFTTLGHIIIEFLQVYCLFMYHNVLKTTVYEKISAGMLLINPQTFAADGTGKAIDYVMLLFPPLIIVLTGLLGYFLRRSYKGEKTLTQKVFY